MNEEFRNTINEVLPQATTFTLPLRAVATKEIHEWSWQLLPIQNEHSDNNDEKKVSEQLNKALSENLEIINILEDFYLVEGFAKSKDENPNEENETPNKKEENPNKEEEILEVQLKNIATIHSHLLRLKLFFNIKLSEYLTILKKSNSLSSIRSQFYLEIEQNISIWQSPASIILKYLLEDKSASPEEQLSALLFLYSDFTDKGWHDNVFIRRRKQNNNLYYSYYRLRTFPDNEISPENFKNLITEILNYFDNSIKEVQDALLTPRQLDIADKFGKFFGINNLGEALEEKFKTLKISNKVRETIQNLACYARADYKEKKYITINGIDKIIDTNSSLEKIKTKLIEVLQNTATEIEYVQLSNDVRYYLKDGRYITYKQYEKYTKCAPKENRAFTCCERKLLAEICGAEHIVPKDKEITLWIAMPPCLMCQRTFKCIDNDEKIKQHFIGELGLSEKRLDNCDKMAQDILDQKSSPNPRS